MKKIIFFLSLLLSLSISSFAQVTIDPNDDFYNQVERWETLKIIQQQPPLRPYPYSLVESILKTVIESDNEKESQKAQLIYEQVTGKKYIIAFDVDANAKISDDNTKKQALALYGLNGDAKFNDIFSAGYKLDFLSGLNPELNVSPLYAQIPYYMADGSSKKSKFNNYMEVDGGVAFNFKDFYIQAGINHQGFGSFYDKSTVISPNAKHTANFSFTYLGSNWSYTQGIMTLSATNAVHDTKFSNKWLMFHSADVNFTDWFSMSFYETVIYGQRFDPSYMIPMLFMVTQGVTGYDADNLFMGATLNFRPISGLTFTLDGYLDDIGFRGLKQYHDIKLRGTAQAGVKYIPDNLDWLDMIKLDYTVITPFMYAHRMDYIDEYNYNKNSVDYKKLGSIYSVNYQTYTTSGCALGSNLPPNSDRIALAANFTPMTGLKIGLATSFVRHANVTEGLTVDEQLAYLNAPENYFATDGSLNQCESCYFKDPITDEYRYKQLPSAWNKSMILTQPSKLTVFNLGLDVNYEFPKTNFGQFSVGLSYGFEYIKNKGVDSNIFVGEGTIEDGKFKPGTKTDAADVEAALATWRSNFHDEFNQFVTINFGYRF